MSIGEVKYLHFTTKESEEARAREFVGCIGSVGGMRKLYLIEGEGECARFILYTDDGAYDVETWVGHPALMTLRFLCIGRADTTGGESTRMLFFNPQIVASIEKAGMSFINHSRLGEYKSDEEIEILDEYSAVDYLRESEKFSIDDWADGVLDRVLWCDKNGRPLCEGESDFSQAARFDYWLWSVLEASHSSTAGTFNNTHFLESFLDLRYAAYRAARNGVVQKWENFGYRI